MRDIYIARGSGLGDVLMLAGAAKAISARGFNVHLGTMPEFEPLLRLCPHIASINTGYCGWYKCLDECLYGIAGVHQTDAYLKALGVEEPDPEMKRIELRPDINAQTAIEPLVHGLHLAVLHPALTDPNRTWPMAHWQRLADLLKESGYTVVQIGRDGHNKGVHTLNGVVQATNLLSLTETLEMVRASEVFISTDSGPVQLAGATKTRMVVIYSSVDGRHRIPFGSNAAIVQAPCAMAGCYRFMHEPSIWQEHVKQDLNDTFQFWCPAKDNYGCLGRVTPEMVMSAI